MVAIGSDFLPRSDSGKNNADLSECSTNTEDYITCTDNSKRVGETAGPGTKTPSAQSSSSTQVPGSNPRFYSLGSILLLLYVYLML